MNTVSPQLYEIFEDLEKNDDKDNSRGSRNLIASWRRQITHLGRTYTNLAFNRTNYGLGEFNYGTQRRLKITSGPNTKLTGGLKWNK